MTQIEEDSFLILKAIAEYENKPNDQDKGTYLLTNEAIAKLTELPPKRINAAILLLSNNGFVKLLTSLGTAPYKFRGASITPFGWKFYQNGTSENNKTKPSARNNMNNSRINPIGSPYGFKDEDWEFIERKKSELNIIRIVFGHQFKSTHYDSEQIKINLKEHLASILKKINESMVPKDKSISLEFISLSAGYGEHLFNEIARDIIASDIAIFETSDSNPNVMIELGVALTWGIRVLPIIVKEQNKPPSDISGQTYARYSQNALEWDDPEHDDKIAKMIERVMRKKGSL